MIAFALSYALLLVSIVVVAFMRMMSSGAKFTYGTVAMHLALQGAIATIALWISSFLGPLDNRTVAMTGLMLMLEAAFRISRKLRGA